MKDEVDFLPANKYRMFLQIDAIILGVCGKACPNYLKEQVCYFLVISQERSEWWSYKHECFLQIDTKIFDGHALPKFQK